MYRDQKWIEQYLNIRRFGVYRWKAEETATEEYVMDIEYRRKQAEPWTPKISRYTGEACLHRETVEDERYEFIYADKEKGWDVSLHWGTSCLGPSWVVRWGPGANYASGPLECTIQKGLKDNSFVKYFTEPGHPNIPYRVHAARDNITFAVVLALAIICKPRRPFDIPNT